MAYANFIILPSFLFVLCLSTLLLTVRSDFTETFALSPDRSKSINELLPGTVDFYFYRIIHLLNQGGPADEIQKLLTDFERDHRYDPKLRLLRDRFMLSQFDPKNPSETFEWLRTYILGLRYDHYRQEVDVGEQSHLNLPTQITPDQVGWENIRSKFSDYEIHKTDSLLQYEMMSDADKINDDLLQNLFYPDVPNLIPAIVKSLTRDHDRVTFGSVGIHNALTLEQMNQLLKECPTLIDTTSFIDLYLSKLVPNDDVVLANDDAEKLAYFSRLSEFINKLSPAYNRHRVTLRFNQLLHGLRNNHFDEDLFMQYLMIPKWSNNINSDFFSTIDRALVPRLYEVPNLAHLETPNDQSEESLVSSFLLHIFSKPDAPEPATFSKYLQESYLTRVHAKAKLLYTDKDLDKYTAILGSSAAHALKESIEINLLPHNKRHHLPSDVVSIDVELKNVPTLIVKVFEINAEKYYKDNLATIPDSIQLDGLVANEEKLFKYDLPAFRRHKERFDFPALSGRRGVFVIEFIGNGMCSRSVIRKGGLHLVHRTSPAGHIARVFDEKNQLVKTASIWLNGHLFSSDSDGEILIPFTKGPAGTVPCIIINSADGFADLAHLDHANETYNLEAKFYCDRELLLTGRKATVIIQSLLRVSGSKASLSILKDVVFTIETTDIDGVSASKDFRGLELKDDADATIEFQVPDKLQSVSFVLKADIRNLSGASTETLSSSRSLTLNGIDVESQFRSIFLRPRRSGYEILVLGKSGEPATHRSYTVSLKHRFSSRALNYSVMTDENGIIKLPPLPNYNTITVTSDNSSSSFQLAQDFATKAQSIQGTEGEMLELPYMVNLAHPGEDPAKAQSRALLPGEVALFERRQGSLVADHSHKVTLVDGVLRLTGLTRGEYQLYFRRTQSPAYIQITKGIKQEDVVVSDTRVLDTAGNISPLQISKIELPSQAGAPLKIFVKNFSEQTRLHVIVSQFWPEYDIEALFRYQQRQFAFSKQQTESSYLDGRSLGDEYRYILERKYAKTYPGNTLTRPSLLLQPRAVQETTTDKESLLSDMLRYAAAPCAPARSMAKVAFNALDEKRVEAPSANLDFLLRQSVLLTNLRPDKNGIVNIPSSDLIGGWVRVVAVDDDVQIIRSIALDGPALSVKDMRLQEDRALDSSRHFTEQKSITEVQPGEVFICPDITTSKIEVVDSLAKVFSLLSTLSHDSKLAEFSFVLQWTAMTDAEKQDKYSKYACHELNTFIKFKDHLFFSRVVKPYIANKKELTFIDRWLIGADLTEYLTPSELKKLNAFEKAVLASSLGADGESLVKYLLDAADALHVDVAQYDQRFNAALKGSALETTEAYAPPAEPMMEVDASSYESSFDDAYGGDMEKEMDAPVMFDEADDDGDYDEAPKMKKKMKRESSLRQDRREPHQFFKEIDQTKEFAETNYWSSANLADAAHLVPLRQFWADFASRNPKKLFLSKNFIWASNGFAEVMFTLSVLDLPLQPPPASVDFKDGRMTIKSELGLIVFHKDLKEAAVAQLGVLATQSFFDPADRYAYVRGEHIEKYVQEEFLRNKIYGCNVVLTNVGASRQRASVLLQIPVGAIPVSRGLPTKSQLVDVGPYESTQIEYFFYWPSAGVFPHFPAHVARDERVIAFAQPMRHNVVASLSKIDRTNWDWISQMGSDDDVIAYLEKENVHAININRIAWRMRDESFFHRAVPVLARRHAMTDTLLSYSLYNGDVSLAEAFLRTRATEIAERIGYNFASSLVNTDAVRLRRIEHLEYSPIVNARAHQIGAKKSILNDRFKAQYKQFVELLCFKPSPLPYEDILASTYYFLLQDRIEEAQSMFGRIPPAVFARSAPSGDLQSAQAHMQLQYDYLAAYLDFYNDVPTKARAIAQAYVNYPVPRWANLFAEIRQQLAEIDGVASTEELLENESRDQRNQKNAAKATTIDFSVTGNTINLHFQAATSCTVKIFKMDIELLFSNSPFVQQDLGNFAYIMPNSQFEVALPQNSSAHAFELPAEFQNANVMILISSGPISCVKPHFAHSLMVNVIENYGQLKVFAKESGKPHPRAYVKVYARHRDGSVSFYKDGYTDLRGGFDYVSLNTRDVDTTEKFSILVMSNTHGTRIVEARPPQK